MSSATHASMAVAGEGEADQAARRGLPGFACGRSGPQRPDRHHGDVIGRPVAIAAGADHRQEGGFPGAMRVDLMAKAQQADGGGLHLARAELDIDRAPAAIAQLHDRVHLHAVGDAVVEHLAIQCLGLHPQVADHE